MANGELDKLDRHRVSHLVRNDADGGHVSVRAQLGFAAFACRASNTSSK